MGTGRSKLSSKSCEANILVLGLDNSGKTTILKRLTKGKNGICSFSHLEPTQGSFMVPLQYNGFKIKAMEVGGSRNARSTWSKHFAFAHGLVYVIDSSARKRVEEVGVELKSLLQDEGLRGVPLVVCANKQDLFGAFTVKQLTEGLNLHLTRGRLWQIKACSAQTGQGLDAAMEWLLQTVVERNLSIKEIILHNRYNFS